MDFTSLLYDSNVQAIVSAFAIGMIVWIYFSGSKKDEDRSNPGMFPSYYLEVFC